MYKLSGSLSTSYPGWPVGEKAILWDQTSSPYVVLYEEIDKGGTTAPSTLTLGSATFPEDTSHHNVLQGETTGFFEVGHEYRIYFNPSSSGPQSTWDGPLSVQGYYELAVVPIPAPGAALLASVGLLLVKLIRRKLG